MGIGNIKLPTGNLEIYLLGNINIFEFQKKWNEKFSYKKFVKCIITE